MGWRLAAVLACARLIAGCVPTEDAAVIDPPAPCDISLRVEPGFAPEEQAAIVSAVVRWNAITKRPMCVRDDGVRLVRHIAHDSAEWQARSDAVGVAFIGLTTGDEVLLVEGQDARRFAFVIRHELGHVLGLQHVPGPAVMAPATASETDDFVAADIDECRRVSACD